MMERHSKKELTRLILTALVLAGGSFYIPMAEAADVTGQNKTISEGTYENTRVYAGRATDMGANATNNKLTISGGSFSGSSGNYTHIYGGWAPYGNATGNEVIILGGTFDNLVDIIGGNADSGQSATGNQVTLAVNNRQFYQLSGGIAGGSEVYTDNTLNLNGTGNNVAFNLYGFDTIAVQSGVTFAADTIVLRTGTTTTADYNVGIQCANNATLDFTGATNLIGNNTSTGTMTILTSERHDMSGLKVKNESGTAVAMGTTANPVTVKNHAEQNDGAQSNLVTLNYKPTHTVYFSDDYWHDTVNNRDVYNIKVKYNIANVLSSINLANWNGSAVAVPTTLKNGLTANSITAAGFTPPTVTTDTNILTTDTENYFSNSYITGALKYGSSSSSTTDDKNITFTVTTTGGVKASDGGYNLVYSPLTSSTTKLEFGAMAWGDGGSGSGYTFSGSTNIDASNLSFTDTSVAFTGNPIAGTTQQSMNLLTGATGITAGTITNPTATGKGTLNTSFTTSDGIGYTGTAKGTVSVSGSNVVYTLNSGALSTIDLSSATVTENMSLPDNWTGSSVAVNTGSFDTSGLTEQVDIFTTTTDNFFGTVTGARAYDTTGTFSGDEDKGVTLAGNKMGGVTTTNSGRNLTYIPLTYAPTSITLGAMAWGTPREASTAYDFTGVTSIDASNLTFTNPLSVGTTASLLTNAANLSAGLPITYASGTSHSQNFTNAAAANGAALSGTINGTVASTAGTVDYTVTGKSITGINLSGWDSTKGAYDLTGWTGALAADSINAAGFTAPTTLTAGGSIDILTTGTDDFFADSQITGALKYGAGASSTDEDNGVIFTGTQSKGVKASANGQKLVYAAGDMAVTGISFGTMTPGTARTVTTGYDFSGVTSIDAAGLKFTKPEEAVNGTLVSAGGLTYTTVSNPNHSQAITSAALGNGITGSGTLTGTVSASAGTISYTVGGKSLASMNLSGWNGTTTSLPAGWTGSNVAVTTGSFVVPNGDTVIFNGGTAGFFGTVTGDRAYKDGVKVTEAAKNGVALTGTKNGGVKAIDNGATLKYFTETMNANAITLGKMTWGTGRAITESGYTFDGVGNNGVDATSLTFAFAGNTVNTIASGDDWDLVTGASGLAAGLTVKGSPVSQQVSYGISNVASLTGTLTGKVTTNTNAVHYAVTGKTLNSIDISAWNGTTTDTAVDASWSKNPQGISVTGSGFTTPTVTGEYNILTAGSTGFFTGAQIDSSIAYQPSGAYSETEKNITLSGKQARGVLASSNGMALQYKIGTAYIDIIKLGQVAYSKDAVLLDKSGAMYNYANVTALDKSGFRVTMTDDQRKTAQTADSMTLVKANGTLNNLGVQDTQNSKYTYTANPGLTVKGTIVTNLTATGGSVLYTVDSNKASDLTVGSVTWNSTYARPGSEIAYSDAIVNAENVTFSGVSTLKKGDTMTLVSNFGTSVNKVRGGIFTLSNGKTGKGHAYWDSATGSLVYVVDRGVDEEVETKTAIGTKTIIINEQPHQGDVPGGEAEGDGEAKDNETIIKKSHIKKNPDGTGGDTNGGTSEDGDADKNKLDIEESEIDGDATGGQSDTGNTDDNETIIKKKSVIHGGVAGGETLGGHGGSRRNKTTVEESTVEGDVDGGKTGGDGETEENEVVITGSKIGGDVNGGHSGGDGDSSGNEVTVDNSTVDGDVNGGKSDGNGNTKNNKVDIKKGSKIGGSVHGGHSGGSGDSTGNEVTVDGSEVDGNVMGGRTKDGNANNNTVNIDGGSTINGSVYGGYSDTGDASGNNVNIGTGKINGDIYGGYSGGTGSTINNTVTLYGDADVSGSNIIGGSNGSTGNTLNIGKGTESWTGGGQTVKNVSNFDTLNFTALPWNSDTPALTIGDGSATDLSNTTVTARQVAFTGVKTISVGSTMMFLDQSNVAAGKKATNINSGSDFTVGTAMEGTGKLVLDANGNVIYQVETAGVSRQTHNTVMAAEAAVVALNAGNDFILSAREGLARKENIGKDGIAVFAKIGGGATRQETGSHVNVNMWNGIVAVGRKNVQKESTTEYGVFVEHGWGNFSTHSDNAQRGDGSVDYTGGGLLGKWTKADGLYVEGSLRIGSMHEKANNLLRDTVRGYGYDERTTYKGFHLGVGKEFAIKDGNTVEVYGKYFYNRKDGMNFNAGLDEYNLDAVTSQILRIGARYTMKRERWNYYGDLSYEHELDGKAAGRANGMAIRGADTSGGSVRLELGAKLLANEKSPWTLDLNLTGYAGKKQGLQGGVSVKFMF